MTPQDFLRLLMEKHKDNPNSLARRSKVPQSTIFRFLTGTAKEPRLSTLEKIARVYGVPVEAFLSDKHRRAEVEKFFRPPMMVEEPQRQYHEPTTPAWPFKNIAPDRYFAASPAVRAAIEEAVEKQLAAFEREPANPKRATA